MGVLDSLESGLKSILPYALPAALGAGLGGPLGGLAGVAAAQPDPETQLDVQEKQLEIQNQRMALAHSQAEQAGMQALYKDPGFQAHMQQATGISPDFWAQNPGLGINDITQILKLRQSGQYGAPFLDPKTGTWMHQNEQTQEISPLGGTPSSVVAERERGDAEGKRTADAIAAANARTDITQKGAAQRQDAALAARNNLTPAQVAQGMDRAYTSYISSHGKPPLGILESKESWAKGAIESMMAEPGVSRQAAESKAAAAIGWVPLERKTKDGRPVYLDMKTGKKYAF